MPNSIKLRSCRQSGRRLAAVSLGLTAAILLATPGISSAQGFGTIKGRLVWGGADVPTSEVAVKKGDGKPDSDVCTTKGSIVSRDLAVDPKTKGVAYGFAYIIRPKGKNPAAVKELLAKEPKALLDQKFCEFQPFVLAIHTDQPLILKSSDPVSHNVRLQGFNNPGLNQTLAPKGSLEIKLKPERVPIQVACDIHPWMHSFVMVFDHTFFATTGLDGTFEIKGVPAGTQNLIVRHDSVGFVTPGKGTGMPVTVTADQVTDVGDVKLIPK